MSRDLVGTAWLDSDERTAWETRVMRRRVPLYRAGIAVLRGLNALTGGRDRPSLAVTRWHRIGPQGGTFVMDKLETMTGRTDHPVTSRAELRARTSFASRLARAVSADEWPQIIAEYERRRRGEEPQYRYVGHRPLNAESHALMDEAWVRGELPTDPYRAWNVLKHEDDGAFYSEFFTHGGARGYSGGETNRGFRLGRVMFDVGWREKASLDGERAVLRRSRVLRATELVKFLRVELAEVVRPPAPSSGTAVAARRDVYTPEVVAAVSDFVKPEALRSPTARGEVAPSRTRASAVDVANTVAKALPPAVSGRAAAEGPRGGDAQQPAQPRPSRAGRSPGRQPGDRPRDQPAR